MSCRSIAWALLAVVALATPPCRAEGPTQFSVAQVRQLDIEAPAVRAYLELTDAAGAPLSQVPLASLSATLGEWPAEPVNLLPFADTNQGIAYVFLVDISRSLNQELFALMVSGIKTWVEGMGDNDRAAIIAFGETSRLIVDFTHDKEALFSGLASLGPTDDLTLLHQALADALDLSSRLDADLPGRRAVVVFSDGKDEGSVFEVEDVMVRLREGVAPIYAIGYSRLRNPAERQRYLNLLQRLASNSGGTFFAAEETRFAEAYDSIHRTIRQVWMADFLCTACRADGELHRLQVNLSLDGHVVSGGGAVRLLPIGQPTSTSPAEPAALDTSRQTVTSRDEEVAPPADLWPWVIGLSTLAVVLLLLGAVSAYRRRSPQSVAPGYWSQPPTPPVEPSPRRPMTPPETDVTAMPVSTVSERASDDRSGPTPSSAQRTVRLIVVRGSRKGRQYTIPMPAGERAVVGKRSTCDCVLGEEGGIDAVQFELLNEGGDIHILNLSNRMPTLLAGQPLDDKTRLQSDALVGTGETILRIVF
jgi:VWFA-related protein